MTPLKAHHCVRKCTGLDGRVVMQTVFWLSLNPSEPCSPPCTWLKSFPKLPTMQARPFATKVPLSSKSGKLVQQRNRPSSSSILLKYDTQPQRRAQSVMLSPGVGFVQSLQGVGEPKYVHPLEEVLGPGAGRPIIWGTEAPVEPCEILP